MKNEYIEPVVELVGLEEDDVIATSGEGGSSTFGLFRTLFPDEEQ